MSAFVVDASVALCWLIPGQQKAESISILESARRHGILVPIVWHLEITNQLGLKQRAGYLAEEELTVAFTILGQLEIDTAASAPASRATVNLMNRFQLTAYDASYLALALDQQAPLATFDKNLVRAAVQAGLTLL